MKALDTYNAVIGGIVAVLSYIFGEHWILFALFLAFNIADWITGWMKSLLMSVILLYRLILAAKCSL